MRKKLVWIIPVVAVLGFVLLAAVASLLIPADRTATLLAGRVNAATGWRLELDSVKFRLWPRAGLQLGPGRVSELPPESGVKEASWIKGSLDFPLLPLLRGRFQASRVSLGGVDCRGRNGTHAYDLAGGNLVLADLALDLENESGALLPASGPCRWRLEASRFQWDGYAFDDLDGRGWADADSVTAESLHADLDGGAVTATAAVALGAGPGAFPFRFTLSAKDVPAVALLSGSLSGVQGHWDGALDADASGRGTVRHGKLDPASLEVDGLAVGENGVVHAADWLEEIAPYLGSRRDLMEIGYEHLEQPLRIAHGRFDVDLRTTGPDTDWRATGSIGLDGDLDVDLAVKLPAGFTPDLGGLTFLAATLRDKDGRLTLAAKLTGTTRRARFDLDLDRTLQGGAAEPGKGLPKGLGGFLDKLKVR